MYKENVIGFDCREMWLPNVESWPSIKKDQLIKPDIEKLLTIDRTQWQSVFVSRYILDKDKFPGTVPGYSLEIPMKFRSPGWFWDNLDAMQIFLEENANEYQRKCWLIAITVVETPIYKSLINDIDLRISVFVPLPLTDNSEINPTWILLGYDVEDGNPTFWEGLHGGPNSIENLESLRTRWGKDLNKYHLFAEQKPACEFADHLNELEPKRLPSPFLVYGLYLINTLPKLSLNS